MMTKDATAQLTTLLALHTAKSAEFTEAEAAQNDAQATFKKAQTERYAARRAYQEARRSYIQDCLEKYQKVLCAYCKQLRRLDRVKTAREVGYYWDSDCSYSRWQTPYDRRFAICERCIPSQTYSIHEQEGYKVGKELIDFDQEAYMRWLTYGDENLEIAAKALGISFPALT